MVSKEILLIGLSTLKLEFTKDLGQKYFRLDRITNRKINSLKKKLENNEYKLSIIVFSENLLNYIKTDQDIISFCKLIETLDGYKKIILIKETFLDENPTVFDFQEQRQFTLKDVKKRIKELELQIAEEKKQNQIKVNEIDKSRIVNNPINNDYYIEVSMLKLDLEGIYKKEIELISWLNTYRKHEEKLTKLKQKQPLIKGILKTIENIDEEKYSFRYFKDISEIIKDEIIDVLKDELFNFYISHDNYYSQEFEDFIQLFEKYLRAIEGIEINLDVQKTKKGAWYVIRFTNNNLQNYDISQSLENFNEFLDLCNNSPDLALKLIETKIVDSDKALEIIQTISKKYKRLILDFQQQKERIQLSIKQELQAELLELNISQTPLSLLNKEHGIGSITNFQVNPTWRNEQILRRKYEGQELELIRLVEKYANQSELVQVKSNIDKLKDEEIKEVEKSNTIYRLKKSLQKISLKVVESTEKIAVDLLFKYLNEKFLL